MSALDPQKSAQEAVAITLIIREFSDLQAQQAQGTVTA